MLASKICLEVGIDRARMALAEAREINRKKSKSEQWAPNTGCRSRTNFFDWWVLVAVDRGVCVGTY